jgi:hypothetical protein
MAALLDRDKESFEASFTPAQGALVALLRERGRIVSEDYDGERVLVSALVTPKLAGQMRKLMSSNGVKTKPNV